MPCCCGSRVAGSGNPKRSRANRSARGVLPKIAEVRPGVRADRTRIRARGSKFRETRRDVAFASGCSATGVPRIVKSRCERVSRNGRWERRRRVRTRRARSPTCARGRRDGRPRETPIGRGGRTGRRISVQGKVRDRRTGNPAGNQAARRISVAATVAGNQTGPRVRVAGDRRGNPIHRRDPAAAATVVGNRAGLRVRAAAVGTANRNQIDRRDPAAAATVVGHRAGLRGQGRDGGDRESKPNRPTGPSRGGDRGWKPSGPAGQTESGGDRWSAVDLQEDPAETTADGNRIARRVGQRVKADEAAGRQDAGAGRAAAEEDRQDDRARRALQTETRADDGPTSGRHRRPEGRRGGDPHGPTSSRRQAASGMVCQATSS